MAKRKAKAATVKRIIPIGEATRVERPDNGPWKWPSVAYAMISDSFQVMGHAGMDLNGAKGGPINLEYAVNFLERLYKLGYAVVELEQPGDRRE